jgi:hypothetical protein
MPATWFARLAKVAPPSLHAALRGEHYLGGMVEADLQSLSLRVVALAEALRPLAPTSWEAWGELLGGDVAPEKIREMVTSVFGREE